MRISTGQMVNNTLMNIQDAFERFSSAQGKVASGKQLSRPSDNPTGTQLAMGIQNGLDDLEQYKRNMQEAKGFMGTTDNSLSQVNDLLREARSLAVQGANGTIGQDTRTILAQQVTRIVQQLGLVGNAAYANRYVFGGQRTTNPPFIGGSGGSFIYQGGSQTNGDDVMTVNIGPNNPVQFNVSGDKIFSNLFPMLTSLSNNIANGRTVNISNDDLAAIDSAIGTVLQTRAEVGSKIQRIEQTSTQLEQTKISNQEYLSNIMDTDIASAAVELQTAQLTYQAALSAAGRSFTYSLLDFIR